MTGRVIPLFDGNTYEEEHDRARLQTQLQAVRSVMLQGGWFTISEIKSLIGGTATPQSISARLRDLRKQRFGGFEVQRRRRGSKDAGLFEYRLSDPAGSCPKVSRPPPDMFERAVLKLVATTGVKTGDSDVDRLIDWLLSEAGI